MVRQKSNRKILYKTAKVKVYLHILRKTSIYVYAYMLFFIYRRWITLLTFFFFLHQEFSLFGTQFQYFNSTLRRYHVLMNQSPLQMY